MKYEARRGRCVLYELEGFGQLRDITTESGKGSGADKEREGAMDCT